MLWIWYLAAGLEIGLLGFPFESDIQIVFLRWIGGMEEFLSFCLVMDLYIYGNYCLKQGVQRETRVLLLEKGDGRTRESHVGRLGTHALDRHCS